MLGLRYTSAEDVADCVLRDMLNWKNPGKPNWHKPKSRIDLNNEKQDSERHYAQWVGETELNTAKKYLDAFLQYPTEKYRSVFPTPTTEDYFLSTRTDFKTVPTDDVNGTWEEMKNSGKYEHTKSPLSDSEYLVDHETGDIYRMSDHWGPAASCYWTLDGKPGRQQTEMRIAKSNIKDFGVWHNAREKDVKVDMSLREYAREVEQSIINYRDVLAKVPMTDAHRARFERGLAMLEDVQRRLEEGGYKPKKEDLKYQKDGENGADSLDGLKKASDFILSFLKGKTKQRRSKLEIPKRANRLAERAIGHKINSHTINANELIHAKKRHGVNGTANTENSIPLRDEDFALMPYIMSSPTRVVKGSMASNGTESVRYEKDLPNGIVIVVEREGKFDVSDMENITMFAEKKSATNVTVAQMASHSTSETIVISEADAANIRQDAENAIRKDKKLLEESKLADGNAPVYREGKSVDDSKTDSESSEDYDLYRTVEDEDTIAFLEGQPSVTTYRSMALIDGKLYPPMSSKEMGSKKLRNPSELGKWEESEEAPDKAYKKGDGWYYDLKKDNGKTTGGVAYNPYIHTSTTMLNDQFSEAQSRDNLVVVEMKVP
ncbi:MAG: hypothetical protein ACI4TU_06270, partial [Candidatus Cryptobacteroides sp.]